MSKKVKMGDGNLTWRTSWWSLHEEFIVSASCGEFSLQLVSTVACVVTMVPGLFGPPTWVTIQDWWVPGCVPHANFSTIVRISKTKSFMQRLLFLRFQMVWRVRHFGPWPSARLLPGQFSPCHRPKLPTLSPTQFDAQHTFLPGPVHERWTRLDARIQSSSIWLRQLEHWIMQGMVCRSRLHARTLLSWRQQLRIVSVMGRRTSA